MPSPSSLRSWLEGCRANFGTAPRRFGWLQKRFLRQSAPSWMQKQPEDRLWQLFQDRDLLLQNGTVVWGHLIQANRLLFEPGPNDHPCAALYSFDPFFDDRPELLEELGHDFYSIKGQQMDDPELQKISDVLQNERQRPLAVPLPARATGGHTMVYAASMVHRAHLPEGVLSNGLFPVLAHPSATPTAMILPSKFWPAEMQRLWKIV